MVINKIPWININQYCNIDADDFKLGFVFIQIFKLSVLFNSILSHMCSVEPLTDSVICLEDENEINSCDS